jgi:N-acetylglutamate synthase/N-acetylornithine aminotransferase
VAYAAVETVGQGVALADLSRRLESLSAARTTASGPVVQVGVFADAANAARIATALGGIGTVTVDRITVGGRTLSQVRLSGLVVPADEAVAAAERAGAHGALLVR